MTSAFSHNNAALLGFPKALIPALVCQQDGRALTICDADEETDTALIEGRVRCVACGETYAIHDGICMMFERQDAVGEVLRDEIQTRDAQAERYDARLSSRYEKEMAQTMAMIGNRQGRVIIEYGCGTGRSTEMLARQGALVLAVDFSLRSLLVLSKKNHHARAGLVFADATQLKTKQHFFDCAISTQVLEHVPTQEMRDHFLFHIWDTLKPDGDVVCSVYHHDLRRRIRRLSQEGVHEGGIFYHYFTRAELHREFHPYFAIPTMIPIDITLPFEARLRLSPALGGRISRIASHVPGINLFGHLLLLYGTKKERTGVEYRYPGLFFRKDWRWFLEPKDIPNCDMVTFFSYTDAERQGFKKKEGTTSIIRLDRPLSAMWEGMRKNFIRKQIQRGEHNGIMIREDIDFQDFAKVYLPFRKQKGLAKDSLTPFREHGKLFGAFFEGRIIAAGVCIADHIYARAWALCSDRFQEGDGRMRDIVGQANRMLLWHAIRWAKETGRHVFDLGGIHPDATGGEERSLTEFKEAFGGERRKQWYYTKIYSRFLFFILRMRRRFM
ncbi:MAG TPA: hypothetical protein DCY48_04665 [Candidatus Magasanikbacteria bacterium]|nr:MAG: hypothetical protein A3I74_03155 [Candidatus Magasanikbacteria bacterium RIFCSPLOWO2_02_FULL_47_16]OGH80209.1 MAG: hypothetical protein A3C10_03435 [Candidatus Magasanikbacteria bacterium RIFCSPHIGHO2_02_FULL_48_18]HAZ29034.1 hypothetical protein [Candidatus Magasanikbacteria bacterium]